MQRNPVTAPPPPSSQWPLQNLVMLEQGQDKFPMYFWDKLTGISYKVTTRKVSNSLEEKQYRDYFYWYLYLN